MGYRDPALVRDNRYKVSLNDEEAALIEALANLTGHPPTSLIRNLALRAAQQAVAQQSRCFAPPNEGSIGELLGAA